MADLHLQTKRCPSGDSPLLSRDRIARVQRELMEKKKPVLPTSCHDGFLLSFSHLEHGKIGQSGGGGIDRGAGNRLPTSYVAIEYDYE